MVTSEWQRRILFGDDVLTAEEIAEHVDLVTRIFLKGIGVNITSAARQP